MFVLLVFMGMNAALFKFQRDDRGQRRKITRWRLPQIIPLLGVAGTLAMMAHASGDDFKIAGTLLIAIVFLFFIQRPTADQIEKLEV